MTRYRTTVLLAATVSLGVFSPHTNAAHIPPMTGSISGVVNGQPVDWTLNILLDETTGEETAQVGNMSPEFGAIMRPVTAMVTIGGPTGGKPTGGLLGNLFDVSGGVFTNVATMHWPSTGDVLELVHVTSFDLSGNYIVSATINGTVPTMLPDGSGPITLAHEITIADFVETITPIAPNGNALALAVTNTLQTGSSLIPPVPTPTDPCRTFGVGGQTTVGCKGSITTYSGPTYPDPFLRHAAQLSTTYDLGTQTMNVHLFNSLTPVPEPTSLTLLGSAMLFIGGHRSRRL